METFCLFCASKIPTNQTSAFQNDDFPDKLFILHKLLQIPLASSCKLLSLNKVELCKSCQGICEEGRNTVDELERLHLKLQTLQATVQNFVLTYEEKEEVGETSSRAIVRQEIYKNLNISALQTTSTGIEASLVEVGTNFRPEEEISCGLVQQQLDVQLQPQLAMIPQSPKLIEKKVIADLDKVLESSSRKTLSSPTFPEPQPQRQSPQAKRKRLDNHQNCVDASTTPLKLEEQTASNALASTNNSTVSCDTLSTESVETDTFANLPRPRESHQIVWVGQVELDIQFREFQDSGKELVNCRVISPTTTGIPDITCTRWPSKLGLQLVQKKVLSFLSRGTFSGSCFIQLQLQTGDATSNLIEKMTSGYVGCIVFPTRDLISPKSNLIFVTHNLKNNVFVGIIPKDQDKIVKEMKTVQRQAKLRVKFAQACIQTQQMTNDE